jgi:hypothetical protein
MTTNCAETPRKSFLATLEEQRWDDHRYYHQCRINQTLHFVSALCFLAAYVIVWFSPALAAYVGWLLSMATRQSGHFFFEPRGYDTLNQATFEHKEAVKVGYNLQRKVVLIAAWAATPILVWARPSVFGLFQPWTDAWGFLDNLGLLWLALGIAAVLARTLWLCVMRDLRTGLAWLTKILTDPFHDVRIYWRAPLHLLRGERYDPLTDWKHGAARG